MLGFAPVHFATVPTTVYCLSVLLSLLCYLAVSQPSQRQLPSPMETSHRKGTSWQSLYLGSFKTSPPFLTKEIPFLVLQSLFLHNSVLGEGAGHTKEAGAGSWQGSSCGLGWDRGRMSCSPSLWVFPNQGLKSPVTGWERSLNSGYLPWFHLPALWCGCVCESLLERGLKHLTPDDKLSLQPSPLLLGVEGS